MLDGPRCESQSVGFSLPIQPNLIGQCAAMARFVVLDLSFLLSSGSFVGVEVQ